jgi:general stress protein CsbA
VLAFLVVGHVLLQFPFILFCLFHVIIVIKFLSQALMYPLLVACKSISNLRKAAAQEVVDKVRQHSGLLVDQVK